MSKVLESELKRRFSYVLDESDDSFIPLYLTATAIHPSLRRFLSKQQRQIVIAYINSIWDWIFHVRHSSHIFNVITS